jgi:hypothetical protein
VKRLKRKMILNDTLSTWTLLLLRVNYFSYAYIRIERRYPCNAINNLSGCECSWATEQLEQ